MKSTNVLLTAILLVLVGGGSFWGGTKYQQSKTPAGDIRGQFAARQGQGAGGNRQGGAGAIRGGSVMGDVQSLDNNTLTVKTQDGSSKIVVLSDSTTYNQTVAVDKSEIKAGSKIAVFGSANSDGTVTAQSVQLNPELRGLKTGSPTPTK